MRKMLTGAEALRLGPDQPDMATWTNARLDESMAAYYTAVTMPVRVHGVQMDEWLEFIDYNHNRMVEMGQAVVAQKGQETVDKTAWVQAVEARAKLATKYLPAGVDYPYSLRILRPGVTFLGRMTDPEATEYFDQMASHLRSGIGEVDESLCFQPHFPWLIQTGMVYLEAPKFHTQAYELSQAHSALLRRVIEQSFGVVSGQARPNGN